MSETKNQQREREKTDSSGYNCSTQLSDNGARPCITNIFDSSTTAFYLSGVQSNLNSMQHTRNLQRFAHTHTWTNMHSDIKRQSDHLNTPAKKWIRFFSSLNFRVHQVQRHFMMWKTWLQVKSMSTTNVAQVVWKNHVSLFFRGDK